MPATRTHRRTNEADAAVEAAAVTLAVEAEVAPVRMRCSLLSEPYPQSTKTTSRIIRCDGSSSIVAPRGHFTFISPPCYWRLLSLVSGGVFLPSFYIFLIVARAHCIPPGICLAQGGELEMVPVSSAWKCYLCCWCSVRHVGSTEKS